MNAILGYTQILQRDAALPPEQRRQALETIEKSGDHLLRMINDILDLSKIEAGRAELHLVEFDLSALIADLASLFRLRCGQKGLTWKVKLPRRWQPESTGARRLPRLRGDAHKLRQVLINLLGNAVKFTESGSVTLQVEVADQCPGLEARDRKARDSEARSSVGNRESEISTQTSEKTGAMEAEEANLTPTKGRRGTDAFCLRFEVTDTGPGVPLETLARLFRPFEQGDLGREAGGAGLGLAIARGLVDLLGGELRVESSPGTGARFWFDLAFTVVAPRELLPQTEPLGRPLHVAAGCSVRALVVDDVAENREILATTLRLLGCECVLAAGGAEAVDLFRAERPDITFLDIRMPGMDGVEALRRLRDSVPETVGGGSRNAREGQPARPARFVAISASVLAHERRRYLDAGFDDFIGKPFRLERITQCLSELLPVRFETEVVEAAPSLESALPALPGELARRLEESAQAFLISDLKSACDTVERLGPAYLALVRQIRRCVLRYDMNGVLELFATVPREKSAGPAQTAIAVTATPPDLTLAPDLDRNLPPNPSRPSP
jgi:signal transduction histidine kinase/DNA-binding NarL/FixJ family response regulator